jgi:hypothetical protein
MATSPPEPTPLSEEEKKAYQKLLCWAMLDIRMLCQHHGSESPNPLVWRRQYSNSRPAGALADWLHNLAQYSAMDFDNFDPEMFWRHYDYLTQRFSSFFGSAKGLDYRKRYEDGLTEQF